MTPLKTLRPLYPDCARCREYPATVTRQKQLGRKKQPAWVVVCEDHAPQGGNFHETYPIAEDVFQLTMAEARALPDLQGRIVSAMLEEHGFYSALVGGRKTLYLLKAEDQTVTGYEAVVFRGNAAHPEEWRLFVMEGGVRKLTTPCFQSKGAAVAYGQLLVAGQRRPEYA